MLPKDKLVAALGVAVASNVYPPPPLGVVHEGTPLTTESTWLAVPMPSRAGVLAAEA